MDERTVEAVELKPQSCDSTLHADYAALLGDAVAGILSQLRTVDPPLPLRRIEKVLPGAAVLGEKARGVAIAATA